MTTIFVAPLDCRPGGPPKRLPLATPLEYTSVIAVAALKGGYRDLVFDLASQLT